eukprot:scaffold27218_cov227-Skeletonema_marinoi.AAC.4
MPRKGERGGRSSGEHWGEMAHSLMNPRDERNSSRASEQEVREARKYQHQLSRQNKSTPN